MSPIEHARPLRYRSIWISDVHLGFRGCQAEFVLDFLSSTECGTLYLVGDILDMWAMNRRLYWPEAHNKVLRAVLDKAANGTRVVYIPGNHDEQIRAHDGSVVANVEVRNEAIHETADGRRFAILHGDLFDGVVQHGKWLAMIGSHAYDNLLALSHRLSGLRRALGLPYWSLAGTLKRKIKNAVNYIGSYEAALAAEARRRGVDGMVCGHIHQAEMREIDGILYCNCGDWVESCTALVEHHDGRMELLQWTDSRQVSLVGLEPVPALARAG